MISAENIWRLDNGSKTFRSITVGGDKIAITTSRTFLRPKGIQLGLRESGEKEYDKTHNK
jgi:hypothetical protein